MKTTVARTEDKIEALLARLKPTYYGWRVRLPAAMGLFLGEPLAMTFEVHGMRPTNPPRPLNRNEKKLARLILENLESILRQAERSFKSYTRPDPGAHARIAKPDISLARELMAEQGPNFWGLQFNEKGTTDHGYSVGFQGTEWTEVVEYDDREGNLEIYWKKRPSKKHS